MFRQAAVVGQRSQGVVRHPLVMLARPGRSPEAEVVRDEAGGERVPVRSGVCRLPKQMSTRTPTAGSTAARCRHGRPIGRDRSCARTSFHSGRTGDRDDQRRGRTGVGLGPVRRRARGTVVRCHSTLSMILKTAIRARAHRGQPGRGCADPQASQRKGKPYDDQSGRLCRKAVTRGTAKVSSTRMSGCVRRAQVGRVRRTDLGLSRP
jgi:hypothetical protein